MKLEKFLQDNYGYNPDVRNVLQSYIEQWKSWYAGNVKSFHNYFIYNGKRKVNQKRFTMNMAKEISEEWADILWSEKCNISLENDKGQENINKLINELDLYVLINNAIEKSGALGTEAAVVSVYDIIENEDGMTLDVTNAKTRIDLVDVDWIFPLSWTNKGITECAFGSVEYIKGKKHIILSVHQLNDAGNYVIKNHLFSESNGNLTEIVDVDNTLKEFDDNFCDLCNQIRKFHNEIQSYPQTSSPQNSECLKQLSDILKNSELKNNLNTLTVKEIMIFTLVMTKSYSFEYVAKVFEITIEELKNILKKANVSYNTSLYVEKNSMKVNR